MASERSSFPSLPCQDSGPGPVLAAAAPSPLRCGQALKETLGVKDIDEDGWPQDKDMAAAMGLRAGAVATQATAGSGPAGLYQLHQPAHRGQRTRRGCSGCSTWDSRGTPAHLAGRGPSRWHLEARPLLEDLSSTHGTWLGSCWHAWATHCANVASGDREPVTTAESPPRNEDWRPATFPGQGLQRHGRPEDRRLDPFLPRVMGHCPQGQGRVPAGNRRARPPLLRAAQPPRPDDSLGSFSVPKV